MIFNEELKEMQIVDTPKVKTIDEVSNFLGLMPKDIVKTLVYVDMSGETNVPVVAMVRGDRELNEIKLVNALGIAEHELRLATYDEILELVIPKNSEKDNKEEKKETNE